MTAAGLDNVHVALTGVQPPRARLSHPSISPWRCNLTALSQVHNLYFVAYSRALHVYTPDFPSQRLARPALIVATQPTNPTRTGYVDPAEPHSINHLIVQFLGNEEVVATVRDNGDVDVVLVRHIVQAIDRRAEPDNVLSMNADEVRPIFQSNVGMSAWGLAIHSQARILATSSNLHEIRVFKFGLLERDNDEPLEVEDDIMSGDESDTEDESARRRDVTQRIINGEANIPHIAFCNTGDDPEGRWLLSTDINGYCRVMDLQVSNTAETTAQEFRFGPIATMRQGAFDRVNAGWAIMFLDRRSFIPAASWDRALGVAADDILPTGRDGQLVWDVSHAVDYLRDNSYSFTYPRRTERRGHSGHRARRSSRRESGQRADDREPLASTVTIETVERHLFARGSPDGPLPSLLAVPSNEAGGEAERDIALDSEGNDSNASGEFEDTTGRADNDEDELQPPYTDLMDTTDNDSNDEMYDADDLLPDMPTYGSRQVVNNHPRFSQQNSLCDGLPCPILHTSVKNVYLLQPSDARRPNEPCATPMVGLAAPLSQAIEMEWGYLQVFDRLNMHAYIPELGVIVLASQKGRAVLFSLTRLSADATSPVQPKQRLGKTCYAMRPEHILPWESQEKQGHRPGCPLHGIAVGPIQGTENLRGDQKRWRLMLMYQEHSVLSYEISRPRADSSKPTTSLSIDCLEI